MDVVLELNRSAQRRRFADRCRRFADRCRRVRSSLSSRSLLVTTTLLTCVFSVPVASHVDSRGCAVRHVALPQERRPGDDDDSPSGGAKDSATVELGAGAGVEGGGHGLDVDAGLRRA